MFDNTQHTKYCHTSSMNISACSGGIYKSHYASWFKRFEIDSDFAKRIFDPLPEALTPKSKRNDRGEYDYRAVVLLQVIMTHGKFLIAELIDKEDFDLINELPKQ